MISHKILKLEEQKYVGIKTKISLKEHYSTDYLQLQKNVLIADIKNIDYQEHFMAIDTDFTDDSFSYTPLVPVHSYIGNEQFTQFTRELGSYCAFDVKQNDLNPAWFKRIYTYFELDSINVENTGYDLEYYEKDYMTTLNQRENFAGYVFKILFKMKK